MNRVEALNGVLRGLQSGTPEVEAAALISEDGLMIASALPQHIDDVRIAGMSSVLQSLGNRAAAELDRGEVEQILIRGSKGYAVVVNSAASTMLLVLAAHEAKLGLIFLDMRRAVESIENIL